MKVKLRAALCVALLAFCVPASASPLFAFGGASPKIVATIDGVASWYGGRFQGRRTANGERFDTNQLTAAHKSLPFGTQVRVTNLANGESVVVRINDRGPYHGGRVIDLSHAAAVKIGMIHNGTAKVKIDVLA